MRIRVGRWLALLPVVLLQACVTSSSVPDLPEQLLNEEGILVARVYMPGKRVWQNASVAIDGYTRGASLRDGYIAIALTPGSHTLQNLRVEGWQTSWNEWDGVEIRAAKGGGGYRAPIYVYTPGSTVYYTTLPINRTFTIETGKITNLGMMVFLVDSKDKKKFATITADNTPDMKRFLEANYPKLMSTIDTSQIRLEPAKYLEPARLPELRRIIGAREALAGRIIRYGRDMLSFGGLGSVAVFKTGADGKISGADVLDTGTTADVVDVRIEGSRALFLTADATLFQLEGGKLQKTSLPFNRHMVKMHRFGKSGLAVVDNHLRIVTSGDMGRSWRDNGGAPLEIPSSSVGVASGKAGFYVYSPSEGSPSAIVYRTNDGDSFRQVGAPDGGSIPSLAISRLVERSDGLYLVYSGSQSFHVLRNGAPEWLLHRKPDKSCKELMFDETQNTLRTKCDTGMHESNDAGATWVGPKA